MLLNHRFRKQGGFTMSKKVCLFLGIFVVLLLSYTKSTPLMAEDPQYEAQIGNAYFLTLSSALSSSIDGDTVYVLKNITATQTLVVSGNKSITLSSSINSIFTIYKGKAGPIINVLSGATLSVENLILDGNNANLDGSFFDIGTNTVGANLNIKSGTIIRNNKSTNGAAAIQLRLGILSIEDGLITANTSNYGIGAIYVATNATFNLSGGHIYDNNTVNSDNAGISIAGGANFNLSGNPQIYDNTSNKNGNDRDIRFIDTTTDVNFTVNGNYTGNIHIWSDKYYHRLNIIGEISEGHFLTSGLINNNRDPFLHGKISGANLMWEYDFTNTTVLSYPTTTTVGSIQQTAIGAQSVIRNIDLAVLTLENYSIEFDGYVENETIISYTLLDDSNGIIKLDYDMPLLSDSSYEWTLHASPTITQSGSISGIHSALPGFSIDQLVLPVLNDTDYTVDYTSPTTTVSGKLSFTYTDINRSMVTFVIDLIDIDSIDYSYNQIEFYGRDSYQYLVLPVTEIPNETTVWLNGSNEIITQSLNPEMEYHVYVKLLVSDGDISPFVGYTIITPSMTSYLLTVSKNEAILEIESYSVINPNPSDEIIDIKVQSILDIENAASIDEVNTIVTNSKIAMDMQRLTEKRIDAKMELDEFITNVDNPSESMLEIINNAKSMIDSLNSISTIENLVNQTMTDVLAQPLIEAKEASIDELEFYLNEMIEPSDVVIGIINDAILIINSALDSSQFSDIINIAKSDVYAQLLLEYISIKINELDAYLSQINQPSQSVVDIVTLAKNDLANITLIENITPLFDQVMIAIDAQILIDEKSNSIAEIDDYVATLLDYLPLTPEIQTLKTEMIAAINVADSILVLSTTISEYHNWIETQVVYERLADELVSVYNQYANDQSYEYSPSGLDALNHIFNAVSESISNPVLTITEKIALLEEAIVAFDDVPIVHSGSISPNNPSLDETTLSPSDFYVSVSNTAGMDKDLRVVVIHIEEMSLQDDIYKAIDLGHVFPNFSTLTIKALQKKLSNQVIFAEIDVKLIDQDDKEITDFSIDELYEVSLLLPLEFRSRENIRVIYLNNDGIEVFDTLRNGNWITYQTNHFSYFYLIGDPIPGDPNTFFDYLNLWWVIILLSVLIILECGYIYRIKSKHYEHKSYSIGLPILLIIIPVHAYVIILIECFIILLLASYIIFIWLNQKHLRELNQIDQQSSDTNEK